MKFAVLICGLVFSLSSLAGLQIQRCLNANLEVPISLCHEEPIFPHKGKMMIGDEKINLVFSNEEQLRSEFVLSDGRSGRVQIVDFEALLQIENEPLIHLQCDNFIPGYCR